MMVACGEACKQFNGLVRNNDTAHFILECLQTETTLEKIIDAMAKQYDAPREIIMRDVCRVVEQLRTEGFLDE